MIATSEGTFWTPLRRRDGLVVTLTVATGSIDAIGLLRLGGVFTSVMTGNMVLLGVAVGKHDASIAIHTGVAFLAYVLGSFVGARVAGHAEENEHLWPRPVVHALALELAVLVVFGLWWELVGATPSTGIEYALLSLNAIALGIQSSAVLRFGISGLSTTYLTGTLTQFIAGLTKRGAPLQARSAFILLALIGGAAAGASAAIYAPRLAPLVPIVALVIVVGGAWSSFHRRVV
ncbi:MAG TPA: YoaK family protein [Acidimicrobiales bacterium]|nr:YoaK family protein [Acidimicrobiales bacterium]